MVRDAGVGWIGYLGVLGKRPLLLGMFSSFG